jgi:hypothetical protein
VNIVELPEAQEGLRDTLFHSLFKQSMIVRSRQDALAIRKKCAELGKVYSIHHTLSTLME